MDRHYQHLNKKFDQLSVIQSNRSTQPQPEDDCQFHTRVKNLTNVRFSQEEMQLLKYGLNYSIENPGTTYLANLTVEKEGAIRLLDKKCKTRTPLWQQRN